MLELESWIDEYDNSLPKLTNFIIYGEDEVSALAHVIEKLKSSFYI